MKCLRIGHIAHWVEPTAADGEVPAVTVGDISATVAAVGTDSALAAELPPGGDYAELTAPITVGWYSVGGEVLHVDDVDNTRVFFRHGATSRHAAGTVVRTRTVSVTCTIPADTPPGALEVVRTSAARAQTETVIVWPYEFPVPDILSDIPRLRQLAISKKAILDIPEDAVEDLRGKLFADGLVLDGCSEPGRCRAVLRAFVLLRAAELGADVLGGDFDRQQQIDYLLRAYNREWQNVARLNIFPRLTDNIKKRGGWEVVW